MLPVSIVVVGIGNFDFELMQFLDSDQERLVNNLGISQKRDNLQFVKQNDYENDISELKKQILQELPDQIEDYMCMKGLTCEKLQEKIQEIKVLIDNEFG